MFVMLLGLALAADAIDVVVMPMPSAWTTRKLSDKASGPLPSGAITTTLTLSVPNVYHAEQKAFIIVGQTLEGGDIRVPVKFDSSHSPDLAAISPRTKPPLDAGYTLYTIEIPYKPEISAGITSKPIAIEAPFVLEIKDQTLPWRTYTWRYQFDKISIAQ